MQNYSKQLGLGVSLLLMLIVVPYSVLEWFDKTIPFSPSLYFISGISILLVAYNWYNFRQKS